LSNIEFLLKSYHSNKNRNYVNRHDDLEKKPFPFLPIYFWESIIKYFAKNCTSKVVIRAKKFSFPFAWNGHIPKEKMWKFHADTLTDWLKWNVRLFSGLKSLISLVMVLKCNFNFMETRKCNFFLSFHESQDFDLSCRKGNSFFKFEKIFYDRPFWNVIKYSMSFNKRGIFNYIPKRLKFS